MTQALLVRTNRLESWEQTVRKLRGGIEASGDPADFAMALLRLDAAFPNLHSRFRPGTELTKALTPPLTPAVAFAADWISPEVTRFRISSVAPDLAFPPADRPEPGDELVAIDGKSMPEWSDANFALCKFPLRAQCDLEMPWALIGRLIPPAGRSEIRYDLRRGERTWSVRVPLRPGSHQAVENSDPECRKEAGRYPGFALSYAGNRLCVFESPAHPSTAILRITSFAYEALSEQEPIRSLNQEIDAVYPWWVEHATWTHLVLDVIGNHGGNSPIPYYQLLLRQPFQEQYFRPKKNPELLDETLRRGVFWESGGQEIWFQELLRSGAYAAIPDGGFLPAIPMFCADESRSCAEGLFEPRPHPFAGRVSVLLNRWCVSSCDGFAYQMKEQLGPRARFIGQAQASDTAYARLALDVVLDPRQQRGFELRIRPLQASSAPAPLLTQTVTVSRSVKADGQVVSGVPVPLDVFIPETLENRNRWVEEALRAALEQP